MTRRSTSFGATLALCAAALAASLALAGRAQAPPAGAADWPESERAFLQEGAGWLMTPAERDELLALDATSRAAWIERFLADPDPSTPANELAEGIARRRELALAESLTLDDARARLLFLRGAPRERQRIDCNAVFKPLEIWRYGEGLPAAVIYRPEAQLPFVLWLPSDGKRPLYTDEMEYWLTQWEELRNNPRVSFSSRETFDIQLCKEARKVNEATGISAISGFADKRPNDAAVEALVAPPAERAAWAKAAAATPLPAPPAPLEGARIEVLFPAARGQRIVTRLLAVLPAGTPLQPVAGTEKPLLRLSLEGVIERDGRFFDRFRALYEPKPPEAGMPVALAADRALRPGSGYAVRLRLKDEVSGRTVVLGRGFSVPLAAQPVAEPPVPESSIASITEGLESERIPGKDGLVLAPPEEEVVIGLYRAQALVSGERIQKVVFLLDGAAQLTRSKPPFTAEIRLPNLPTESVVRAEGYDAQGQLVAADELVLNQPRGALRVRILDPKRGAAAAPQVHARAEIIVPEGRRVERLEWLAGDRTLGSVTYPPWEADLELPPSQDVSYLTAVVTLDDGQRAEDVRFFTTREYFEQVDVNLVELYTTVLDGSGHPVPGLEQQDFSVLEDGRPQKLTRFELVENLPLTLGLVLDTSGSMATRMGEAQRAAAQFLAHLVRPSDQCFALSFADRPTLLVPRTPDPEAVASALRGLQAAGNTSLHDAVVYALYYFRGSSGRRAIVLLSDGEDTSSSIPFRDALEYARRSGVVIYPVGLDVGSFGTVRAHLNDLAQETGGRAFFIKKVEELASVYQVIERELRNQYLLAYSSDRPAQEGQYRQVEVKLGRSGLKARTIRGYYP
jgi:Ca-activated chloride channel family protein